MTLIKEVFFMIKRRKNELLEERSVSRFENLFKFLSPLIDFLFGYFPPL